MKQSIGNFLLRRLKEAGVKHIFGVPGDYNLGDPAWIGNCNELNASYATDAYARINGLGRPGPQTAVNAQIALPT